MKEESGTDKEEKKMTFLVVNLFTFFDKFAKRVWKLFSLSVFRPKKVFRK